MSRTVCGVVLLFAAGMLAVSFAQAGDEERDTNAVIKAVEPKAAGEPAKKIKLQTNCPVMGGAIDKSLYVDHNGKRVYMCCKGCMGAITKDPAKYIKKLESDGITVATLQTVCPVTGGKIDRSLYVDHDGKRIYLCCKGCIAAVQQDPSKYIKEMEDAGVVLEVVPVK